MNLYHDSRNIFYKNPFGACMIASNIVLRIDVYDPIPAIQVFVTAFFSKAGPKKIEMHRVSQEGNHSVYEISFNTGDEACLIWYYFIIQNYNETFYYGNNAELLGGEGALYSSTPPSYQITVYKEDSVPKWFKEGIAYQIFPDRFCKGNDSGKLFDECSIEDSLNNRKNYLESNWFEEPRYDKDEKGNVIKWQYFGGTLNGIKDQIPYLKSLGITVIYLNPIFKAHSNHKYNTADYMQIDPHFGTDKDFISLIKACKKNNIHIILDGVFSHTGKDSIYFQDAIKSKNSPYYQWYKFKNYPKEYECWWNVDDLPNVDELNENYSNFIYKNDDSVIKHYINLGVDGWRLDVADELPDKFIKGLRNELNSIKKETVLLGEVWEDASNKRAYNELREYFYGDELQSVMNYCFRTDALDFFLGKINASTFVKRAYNIMEHYPKEYFYSLFNIIGTHDRKRILTVLSGEHKDIPLAISRLKLLSALQYTIPGIPCLYYGDEAGLEGGEDPLNRKTYPWGKENQELLEHYIQLGNLRNESKALSIGTFELFSFGEHVIAYKRTYEDDCYLILINRGIFVNESTQINYKLIHKENSKKISFELKPLNYKIIKL